MPAKRISLIFGVVLLLVGLIGFVSNPIIGPEGYFATNTEHNLAHIVTGLALAVAGWRSERTSVLALEAFGAVYLLLAIVGFAHLDEGGRAMLPGGLHISASDNWLHLALGIALVAFGAVSHRGAARLAESRG
ncbi:MAG: DUF4383 domain-containing protein [Acidobacteria bacterium]|nr:DUF4383 domain-containing protein [Acidobacteriota bacterium]